MLREAAHNIVGVLGDSNNIVLACCFFVIQDNISTGGDEP